MDKTSQTFNKRIVLVKKFDHSICEIILSSGNVPYALLNWSDQFVKGVFLNSKIDHHCSLNSAGVGFGGWRNGPWYVLDGTNPGAQGYLKKVVKTMREKWGVNYFKMDANYWGAIHQGFHYDKTATRIEAYRRGMKAILEASDGNTVLLGCNAPIWPSLGLVTAMRTSNDISRDWNSFKFTARENLLRCWQNGKLWISDPDCLLLVPNDLFTGNNKIPKNEWIFHATALHATGGMILSGDKFDNLQPEQFEMIKKMMHPTGKGAQFFDSKMETGFTELGSKQYYYFSIGA